MENEGDWCPAQQVFSKNTLYPEYLSRNISQSLVFSLSAGSRHNSLFTSTPYYQIGAKENGKATGGTPVIHIARPVGIGEGAKEQRGASSDENTQAARTMQIM